MSIIKLNTNQKLLKEITINAIIEQPEQIEAKDEDYRREIRLFRDILRFIRTMDEETKDKRELAGICNIEGFDFKETFKIRTLCNWLLENNVDLRNEFANQRMAKTYRAHAISSRISTRLKKLTDLGLISIDDEEIESERNGEKTYQYYVERNGFLIVSLLNLQNFDRSSNQYKRILEFVLNRFLEIIPQPYKTSSNYYYYFLREILHNCLDNHQDILYYFFDLILQHHYNLLINFSVLRYKINNRIYGEIIRDVEFRLLFYKSMNEFKTGFWLRVTPDNDAEDSLINQEKKEALQLVKMQFKLDIEAQIDKDILEVLKTDTRLGESYPYHSKQNGKGVSEKRASNDDKFGIMYANPELDFDIRNKWEKERNSNLSNPDYTTLIVKCTNLECNNIYPYHFEVEKELFSNVSCKICKKLTIRYYDIKTE